MPLFFFFLCRHELNWWASRFHCGNDYQNKRIRNCITTSTSILVDTIPYQVETRFCYGLLTSELLDLHWNENQPADFEPPELHKMWQLTWTPSTVCGQYWIPFDWFNFQNIVKQNIIILYVLFKNKNILLFLYFICILLSTNVSDYFAWTCVITTVTALSSECKLSIIYNVL